MDIAEETFAAGFERPISRGSAIFYPPQPAEIASEQYGVSPHTDFRCLTVLCQDPIGGLEVRDREGQWVVATPIEGTFVINVGDLLARWANDCFASIADRVVNRAARERLSLGLFVDPDFETAIDPAVVCTGGEVPKYPSVRCEDTVLERYAGAFAYRQP